jgi:hypothetical protein
MRYPFGLPISSWQTVQGRFTGVFFQAKCRAIYQPVRWESIVCDKLVQMRANGSGLVGKVGS